MNNSFPHKRKILLKHCQLKDEIRTGNGKEMRQRLEIGVSSCICCLMLILVILLGQTDMNKNPVEYADNFGDLQLFIQYSTGVEKINIWKDDNCFYFFLPANNSDYQITFGNIREKDNIVIGDKIYRQNDNIIEDIKSDVVYDVEFHTEEALQVQQVVFMQSENIPAMFITTNSGTVEYIHKDKEVKEEASMSIWSAEGERAYHGDLEYIKTRGNSTFVEVDKKSYQIKLLNTKSLLGMNKGKKWILLANAVDDSLIRNKLVYDFAADYTDIPSIDGRYVDLYMNGDYVGNYYLCEKVEVGKNRLNITDLETLNETVNSESNIQNATQYISEDGKTHALAGLNNPSDITGGYLLEKIVDGEYEGAKCAFRTDSGQVYNIISPENATIEQVTYIRNLMNETELAIHQPEGIHPETGKHFSEYLDMDSWTSKYLIDEVFHDADTPYASTFLYKDSDKIDPLIYSGPMWDYDRALGGYCTATFSFLDDPLIYGYCGLYAEELLQHDAVRKQIVDKYQEWFYPYAKKEFSEAIYDALNEIDNSAKMNRIRWPQTRGYYSGKEATIDYLEWFLKSRTDFFNEIWLEQQQYHTVRFLNYDGNVCETYRVKHGEYLTTIPDISSYVAIFNGWYSTDTGKALEIRLPVLEDTTYESKWIDINILLQNGLAASEMSVENIDIHELEILVEEIKDQQQQ